MRDSAGVRLQLANLHGDVVAEASTSSSATSLVRSSDDDEFGVPRSPQTNHNQWLGGKQRSTELKSGAITMGQRIYLPTTGRFLQVDPVLGGSANSYDYVNQQPVDALDLSGRTAPGPHPTCNRGLHAKGEVKMPICRNKHKSDMLGVAAIVYNGVAGCLEGSEAGVVLGFYLGHPEGGAIVGCVGGAVTGQFLPPHRVTAAAPRGDNAKSPTISDDQGYALLSYRRLGRCTIIICCIVACTGAGVAGALVIGGYWGSPEPHPNAHVNEASFMAAASIGAGVCGAFSLWAEYRARGLLFAAGVVALALAAVAMVG